MASRVCWHCESKTHMTRVSEIQFVDSDGGSPTIQPARLYGGLFMCDECRWLSIGFVQQRGLELAVVQRWADGQMPGTQLDMTWIPHHALGRDFPDVPDHIASAASEAYVCHSVGAYRSSASMARSVIEATAKDKGIATGRLVDKIEELEKRNLIRPHIKDAAHEVRHLGNDMAHGDFIEPVTEEETAETLELMSEILNEVYQSPAKIARRAAARAAKKSAESGS